MVNPDVRRLQILNDLIAQTLDAINARSMVGAVGLSHSQWGGDPLQAMNPYVAQQYAQAALTQSSMSPYGWGSSYSSPYTSTFPYGTGLSHTPFGAHSVMTDPRFLATDPRLYGTDPRVYAQIPYGIGQYRSPYGW